MRDFFSKNRDFYYFWRIIACSEFQIIRKSLVGSIVIMVERCHQDFIVDDHNIGELTDNFFQLLQKFLWKQWTVYCIYLLFFKTYQFTLTSVVNFLLSFHQRIFQVLLVCFFLYCFLSLQKRKLISAILQGGRWISSSAFLSQRHFGCDIDIASYGTMFAAK